MSRILIASVLLIGSLGSLAGCDDSPADLDSGSDDFEAGVVVDGGATSDDDGSVDEEDAEGASRDDAEVSTEDAASADPDAGGSMDGATDPTEDASSDGGSNEDAGANADAGSVVDGGAPADAQTGDGSSAPTYACHTSAANGGAFPASVVMATGVGYPFALRGNRLLNVASGGGLDSPQGYGWSLWSLANSALIQEVAVTSATQTYVYEAGTSVFLTGALPAAFPSLAELRTLEDGSVLWTSSCKPGGLSPAGSYAWMRCATGDPGGLAQDKLTARNQDGSTWLDVTRTFDTAIATDDALVAVTTNSTDTTLTVYPRSGGIPTTVGPIAGRFLGAFEDRAHVVTLAAGDLVRVYALDGTRKVLMTGTGDKAGGRGDVFWLASSTTRDVRFFKLETAATPLGMTDLGRVDLLHNGLGITHPGTSNWVRVVFSGSSVDIQANAEPSGAKVASTASSPEHFALGIGDQPPLGDSYNNSGTAPDPHVVSATVIDNASTRLGCGMVQSMAVQGERLFVGTKNAGLFVYDPPYAAPLKSLPDIALDVRVAHLSGRFAVLSRDRVRVYNADFSLARADIDLSFINATRDSMNIDISATGDFLSYAYFLGQTGASVSRVIRIATGEVVYEATRTNSIGPEIAFPAVVSPSGHRMVDNVTAGSARIYEDGVLTGTFDGVGVAWVDDSRIASYFYSLHNPGFDSGERLVSYEGIQQGKFQCVPRARPRPSGAGFQPWSDQLQWRDADTIYATVGDIDVCSGCQCELPSGTASEIAPMDGFTPVAGFGVYNGGALYRGTSSVTKRAVP